MKISELSVRYRIAVFMIYLSLFVLGLVAVKKIPLEFMPQMDMPFINIIATYPGASPIEICETIAKPIEETISTMHGIKKIDTRCRSGQAEIGIVLSSNVKTDYQVLEVRERIEQIRDELPEDLPPLLIMKFSSEQWPVIFISLDVPEKDIHYSDLFDQLLVRPLKTIDGVADVQFFGLEEKRVKVEINEDRLRAHHLSVLEVYQALVANNLNLSVGSLKHLERNYSVRLIGQFKSLDEIRRLRLRRGIYLGDIANVDYEYVKPAFQGRVNGRPAYMMFVQKEAGANTVEVCRAVNRKLKELLKNPQLEDVEAKVWFDQGKEITASLKNLTYTGIMGAFFAFFVIWFFLKDFRATSIVSLAIPVSLFITISLMYFLGLSFNMITLSGLVVAIGMLVDNSIVVLEAIYARLQKGEAPKIAATSGADEVGLAISVSTTTTMIVFLPLIFTTHKEVSVIMGQLGVVLVVAIGTSLVVSLTLIPLLASLILKREEARSTRWFDAFHRFMLGWLKSSLQRRWLLLLSVFLIFNLSIGIFYKVVEKESIPKTMRHILRLQLVFDQKPTQKEVEQRIKELERLFLAHKEELQLFTVASIITPRIARISLVLSDKRKPGYTVESLREDAQRLVKKHIKWSGVHISFETVSQGNPAEGGSPTTIKVKGDNPDQVYYFAREIKKRLVGLETIKRVGELEKEGEREVHIEIDRELAQKYGLDPTQIAFTIAYLIRGADVGKFTTEDRQLNLYLQLREADRRTLTQLKQITILNKEGRNVGVIKSIQAEKESVSEAEKGKQVAVSIPNVTVGRQIHEEDIFYSDVSEEEFIILKKFT